MGLTVLARTLIPLPANMVTPLTGCCYEPHLPLPWQVGFRMLAGLDVPVKRSQRTFANL